MAEKKLQTEMVSLPSKGLLYPEGSPLRNGTVEVKYMTAKEEDILTNQTYIKSGVVIDKLLEALVVSPISFKDILIGDKNAIMVAARVYGYGPHYVFNYTNPGTNEDEEVMVDLSLVNDKELNEDLVKEPGNNLFEYELPLSGRKVVFKLLSQGDEDNIQLELKNLRKMKREAELTTRLKHTIVSVDGETDNNKIRFTLGGIPSKPTVIEWDIKNFEFIDELLNDFAWNLDIEDDQHASATYKRDLIRKVGKNTILSSVKNI